MLRLHPISTNPKYRSLLSNYHSVRTSPDITDQSKMTPWDSKPPRPSRFTIHSKGLFPETSIHRQNRIPWAYARRTFTLLRLAICLRLAERPNDLSAQTDVPLIGLVVDYWFPILHNHTRSSPGIAFTFLAIMTCRNLRFNHNVSA
jgi:hypothetical protein